jgi:hypothetical protein
MKSPVSLHHGCLLHTMTVHPTRSAISRVLGRLQPLDRSTQLLNPVD